MEEGSPLFGSRVNLGSVSYFIHGLVHANPLVSISPEFRGIINERLRGYNVLCEDGFAEWIENAASFNETEYFGFNKISFAQYLACLKSYIYNRFIKKKLTRLI